MPSSRLTKSRSSPISIRSAQSLSCPRNRTLCGNIIIQLQQITFTCSILPAIFQDKRGNLLPKFQERSSDRASEIKSLLHCFKGPGSAFIKVAPLLSCDWAPDLLSSFQAVKRHRFGHATLVTPSVCFTGRQFEGHGPLINIVHRCPAISLFVSISVLVHFSRPGLLSYLQTWDVTPPGVI